MTGTIVITIQVDSEMTEDIFQNVYLPMEKFKQKLKLLNKNFLITTIFGPGSIENFSNWD